MSISGVGHNYDERSRKMGLKIGYAWPEQYGFGLG